MRFVDRCVHFVCSRVPVLYGLFGRFVGPCRLFVELTNDCNLSCRYCYSGGREVGYMDFELFKNVVDDANDSGVAWLSLHFGGESLLHPLFLVFVDYLSKHRGNIGSVGVLTNGVLLSVELVDKLVGRLDFVNMSVNGNLDYDSDLVAYMMYRGLDVTLSYSLADPTDADLRFIDREKVRKVRRGFCCEPFQTVVVLWNGDVTVCCHDLQGRMVGGNMSLCDYCEVRH